MEGSAMTDKSGDDNGARSGVEPGQRQTQGIQLEEPLIFERSRPGCRGFRFQEADWDVPEADVASILGDGLLRDEGPELPEVSEPEVVRHFTRMSQWNYAIDTGFYPLGSCTMKYNPKLNEATAREPGFSQLHPYVPDEYCQGALELMWRLEGLLREISGLDACSLQPAAGAQGELTGLMCIRAYHLARGDERRTKIIVPDSAHGTNPASAAFNGFSVIEVDSDEDGTLSPEAVEAVMDETVAGLMITNPNTLGIFEKDIAEICRIVHEGGGKVYMDGANMNAILGKARPGDFGIDVMHFNVHKTFSTPHGGGGPGGGPICVDESLEPYLPVPRIEKIEDTEETRFERVVDGHDETSVGKVKAFWGNFLVYVRAYSYLRTYGAGLPKVSEMAVLNANYLRVELRELFNVAFPGRCMHEVVFDDQSYKDLGVSTMDMAKRLIDYGFHPPTVYFPINVDGALMVEPTETEALRALDEFVATMKAVHREAAEEPELLKEAPKNAFRRRLDETQAARSPVLTYRQWRESQEGA